jgi:hypothetical protein
MGDELRTIATVSSPEEAALIKNLLEDAGIPACLANEGSAAIWSAASTLGAVKVQVAEPDAGRARRVLARHSGGEDEGFPAVRRSRHIAAGAPRNVPPHDEDGEEEWTSPREQDASRALRAAVVGLFLPPLQLYATWLLLRVWLTRGRLDDRGRHRAWVAAGINGVVVGAFCLLVGGILFGKPGHPDDWIELRDYRHPPRMVGQWQAWIADERGKGLVELDLGTDGRFRYRRQGLPPLAGTGTWGYLDNRLLFRIDHLTEGQWARQGRIVGWRLESLTDTVMVLEMAEGSIPFTRDAGG